MRDVIDRYHKAEQAGISGRELGAAEAVYWGAFTWKKRSLTVCFWNGDALTMGNVEDRASEWSKASSIKFSFRNGKNYRRCKDENSADIRISLDGDDKNILFQPDQDPHGDWSEIGSLAINKQPKPQVSMSLSLLPVLKIDPTNYDFHIRHEFGHALGLLHEHQRELCAGWFNIPQIAKDTGWSEEVANQNIGAFPTEDLGGIISLGPYDKDSIMQYNFALNWYLEKPPQTNPCERDHDISSLSPKDVAVVQYIYGKPASTAAAAPGGGPAVERQPGWPSALTPANIETYKDELKKTADVIAFNAAAAHNFAAQVTASVKVPSPTPQVTPAPPQRVCFNVGLFPLCSVIEVPAAALPNNAQITALRDTAVQADLRGAAQAVTFKQLRDSLDRLNAIAGTSGK
ncbi:M12 family metallopeptidase [Labrys miyagiensis]